MFLLSNANSFIKQLLRCLLPVSSFQGHGADSVDVAQLLIPGVPSRTKPVCLNSIGKNSEIHIYYNSSFTCIAKIV